MGDKGKRKRRNKEKREGFRIAKCPESGIGHLITFHKSNIVNLITYHEP